MAHLQHCGSEYATCENARPGLPERASLSADRIGVKAQAAWGGVASPALRSAMN